MTTDQSLLRQFAEEGNQEALAEFVRSHMNLVYSAALRRTGGNAHAAADVAQQIFILLARHARRLCEHPALTAWLHAATRNAALTHMQADSRRRLREAAALDPALRTEPTADWTALQPIIDDALDSLHERDRTAVLLRFFQQASYREIAGQLNVGEDAARMRTDRALQKLRKQLEKRGVPSLPKALGEVLAQHAVIATPSSVAAMLISDACATTPQALGLFGFLAMSKITSTVLSGVIAALVTAGVWVVTAPGVNATELAALRAENENLRLSTGTPTTTAASANGSVPAEERAKRLIANLALVHEKKADPDRGHATNATAPSDPTRHHNQGIATLRDAVFTFAWATDTADVDALAAMIWMDPMVREKALRIMANQPSSLVALYPTPERFYAFITAAVCLQAPPPQADIIAALYEKNQPKELSPGRVQFPNLHEYQQTEYGWKWVFPEVGLERWLHVLNESVLTAPPKAD